MVRARRRQRIEGYLDRLYSYALSLSRDRDHARDLVQDCVVRVLGAARSPADERAYRAWLFRILRNAFLDGERRRSRHLKQNAALGEEEPVPDHAGDDRRLIDALTVRRGMARLSPDHREILALIEMAGFSYAEAAALLDIPQGTVMSRLSRARTALLNAIEENNVIPLRPRNGSSAR